MKEVYVTFINKKKECIFELLKEGKFEDKKLFSFIKYAIQELKKNPSCGFKIPKKLWPNEYRKYGIDNLWKYALPNAWRLIYTITSDEVKIINIILEWFNHKDYEKRFGYK